MVDFFLIFVLPISSLLFIFRAVLIIDIRAKLIISLIEKHPDSEFTARFIEAPWKWSLLMFWKPADSFVKDFLNTL